MIARSLVAAGLMSCCLIATSRAETGMASVYAYAGGKTASGERANPGALTAAHRTLPFGSTVKVTNKKNGRAVVRAAVSVSRSPAEAIDCRNRGRRRRAA